MKQQVVPTAGKLAGCISSFASTAVTGSIWFVTQIIVMAYLLFYFLRDGLLILDAIAWLLPLSEADTQKIFARIGETIRGSLYGKLLVASIQGELGGLMFWWIGLPAPVLVGSFDGIGLGCSVVGNIRCLVPCSDNTGFAG